MSAREKVTAILDEMLEAEAKCQPGVPAGQLVGNYARRLLAAGATKGEEPRAMVAGGSSLSISELIRRCEVHLGEQQRQVRPDNALVATLCEAVRMAREYGTRGVR